MAFTYWESTGNLGGPITGTPVNFNTLFGDLTPAENDSGLTDYRCVYVSNGGPLVRDLKVYIDYERAGGSLVDMGAVVRNEVQAVNISGGPFNEGEAVTFQVAGYDPFAVNYDPRLPFWQGNFFTQMRGVNGLNGVLISATGAVGNPTNVTFTITYAGAAAGRDLPEIAVTATTLTAAVITPVTLQTGGPVNVEAPLVDNARQAPAGVTFESRNRGNPYEIGCLNTDEAFPLWFRRTTPAKTVRNLADEFALTIDGTTP